MPRASACSAPVNRAGRCSNWIVPESGACTPAMILARVDLPAPFSPTRPRTRPSSMEKSTPRSARTAPKLSVKPRQSSKGDRAAGPPEISGRPGPITFMRRRRLLACNLRIGGEFQGVVLGQQPRPQALKILDLAALELGDHRIHAVVAHPERILNHKRVDLAVLHHLIGHRIQVEADELHLS